MAEALKLADDLEGLSQLLTKENTGSDAGFDDICWRAAQLLRFSPAPQIAEGREEIKNIINQFVIVKERWDGMQILDGLNEAADAILALSPQAQAGEDKAFNVMDTIDPDYAESFERVSNDAAQRPAEPHDTIYLRGWNEGIEHAAEFVESGAGMADLIDQDDLDQQAKMIREFVDSVHPTQGGEPIPSAEVLATRLREAAYFCTELSALEEHCRAVADELERSVVMPSTSLGSEAK